MASIKVERVTVTPDELKNGWDDASLRKYLNDRDDAQAEKIDPSSQTRRNKKPMEQNHRYRPLRWRNA